MRETVARATARSRNRRSSAAGSDVIPVCTGPGCTHGAARCGQPPEARPPMPSRGRAGAVRGGERASRTASTSTSGSRVRQPVRVVAGGDARGSRGRGSRGPRPALTNSPRSTRGTTRSTAYSYDRPRSCGAQTAWAPRRAASQSTYRARTPSGLEVARRPATASRDLRHDRAPAGRPSRRGRELGVGRARGRAALPGEHVVGGVVRASHRRPRRPGQLWWKTSEAPWSMSCSRRPHQSMLGLRQRAVDVADERVEPQHPAGEVGVGAASTAARSASSAPGRKSTPRLRPALARSRSCTSSSGSRAAEHRVEVRPTSSGTGRSSARASPAATTSATSTLQALAGAAELHDVGAEVVGLHEPRQRAALAQRRHVAATRHRRQHAGRA